MTTIENIRDLFSLLHDGAICEWQGDINVLTLKIDCEYLAERIDKSFQFFYVNLIQIEQLQFATWPNPFDLPTLVLTDLGDIFKPKLEILSARIKDAAVEVECFQGDRSFDYCGGYLLLDCHNIKIYNHDRNEMTIEQLDDICKSYWEEFTTKSIVSLRF